jgi:two-component system, OmpR family, sensor histidine kinase KdpD
MENSRPDPDQLLSDYNAEEARARRGKLKIFFGASAGVGKTYAMLLAAKAQRGQGLDVVVGVLETHGRAETAALLEGLERIPLLELLVQATAISEFNLDAALARKPALILVDELAHTNAPGSRHPKRWQDIEELLDAGIDVFTTLNVQHLESLNDVVGGITGIRVWETVPDTFFDEADDVVLVDIPADELLIRLKAGKVYLPEHVDRASRNFFRKGNLMALRELALRRTADRVEDDVQAYRTDKSIDAVWKTEASVLCCVGPDASGEHLVRSAARLATQLAVEWTCVYVETPKLQRLPAVERERILRTLKLGQDLGAKTAILASSEPAAALVEYARGHNCSKLMIGRSNRRSLWPWPPSMAAQLAQLAPDADLVETGNSALGTQPQHPASRVADADSDEPRRARKRIRYAWTILACAVTGLLANVLFPYFDLANIVMVFLLTVVLVAVRFGRGPAVLAAFVSVAIFDFFFVPPRFSFAVTDAQYLLTFGVMLAVALIIGQLTAGLRYQARVARHREERARVLYEFARDLASLLQTEQVVQTSIGVIARTFSAEVAMFVADTQDRLQFAGKSTADVTVDATAGAAQWAYDNSQEAGSGTDTLAGSKFLYLPLLAPMRTRGVLAVRPENRRLLLIPEQRRHLDTFAALAAIALERVHYVEVAQQALLHMESERLRNSLLSALSHDLRTPLTALRGLAESLALTRPALSIAQLETSQAIAEEARRMSALVNNLLDMARIQSGDVNLRLEWHPFEEVVGSALKSAQSALTSHTVRVDLTPDLPLVEFDAALIERVLYNLLENAGKYTPVGSSIQLSATVDRDTLRVAVSDQGPGVPSGQEESIFEKFTRGDRESATPGVGLGLAISRAIVEAHRGKIWAENGPTGGARFIFTLPLGTPPKMPQGEGESSHPT